MVIAVALRQAEARFGGHPLPQVHIMCAADHVPAGFAGVPFEKDMRAFLQRAPVAHRADAVRPGDEQAAVLVPRLRPAGLAIGAAFRDIGDHRIAAGFREAALVVNHPEFGSEQVGQRPGVAAFEDGPEEARVMGADLRGQCFAGGHGGGGDGRRCAQGGGEEQGGEGHGGFPCCIARIIQLGVSKTRPSNSSSRAAETSGSSALIRGPCGVAAIVGLVGCHRNSGFGFGALRRLSCRG